MFGKPTLQAEKQQSTKGKEEKDFQQLLTIKTNTEKNTTNLSVNKCYSNPDCLMLY
jgi:hypothetical protein